MDLSAVRVPSNTYTPSAEVKELLEMLSYKRPSPLRCRSELEFIKRYLRPLNPYVDGFGNFHVVVGDLPIIWSSHIDTVHETGGRQHVINDRGFACVEHGECLGADCTTGIWLMTHMIRGGVPGRYIFHREEEVGMLGSSWIRQNLPHLLMEYECAIAFDRKGTKSIVTHQCRERTATDRFARRLAQTWEMPELKPDPTGLFTDTLQYAGLIPECTNVSVGYEGAHSSYEVQNLAYAERLLRQLLTVNHGRLLR